MLITFDSILGQSVAIGSITRAYSAGRLPHGLIFAGSVGVGKETAAQALGALFLCENPTGLAPCGSCESCRAAAANSHPDFHVVYRQLVRLTKEEAKAKELSIAVVREFLISKAANKSVMGRGKVFVVREADLMSTAAQNALLKTLEEPFGRTLIILLTDAPDSLLPTIRSRCQLVRFAPLPVPLIVEQLVKRGIDAPAATRAAGFSDGSLGLALLWIGDGVIARAGQLMRIIDEIIASRPSESLTEWFKAASDAYSEAQLVHDDLASKAQATREGSILYLKLASQEFRRRLQDASSPETAEQFCAAIDALVRAESYLESNVNAPLVFQQLGGALQHIFGAAPV